MTKMLESKKVDGSAKLYNLFIYTTEIDTQQELTPIFSHQFLLRCVRLFIIYSRLDN